MSFVPTWMKLDGIMLNKQAKNYKYQILNDLIYIWNLKTNKQNNRTQSYREYIDGS